MGPANTGGGADDEEGDTNVHSNPSDPENDPLFPGPDESIENDETNPDGIFANKQLLRIGYVPDDEDRIVGRDAEIEAVADEVGVVVNDQPPNNLGIYGKTGTGKSLVARHVTQRAERTAKARGVNVATVYIDCSDATTKTKAAKAISRSLDREYNLDLNIPRRGIGADDYLDYLWYDILPNFNHAIVILDEVDNLDEVKSDDAEEEGILNTLSRAEENQFTDCNLGVVTISNKVRYKDKLSQRVESSFHQKDLVFKPYNAGQIKEILENRRDAFHEGVITQGTIEKCSALSAQEHGDARKAIVVLKAAGETAEREGAAHVTEDHVEGAADYAEVDRIKELMRGDTPQAKAALYSLASLHLTNPNDDGFSTTTIYERYKRVCETAGLSTLTYNRVYGLLREQKFLEIAASQRTDGGKKNAREHWLLVDPEVAIRAVTEDMRSQNLATPEELKANAKR